MRQTFVIRELQEVRKQFAMLQILPKKKKKHFMQVKIHSGDFRKRFKKKIHLTGGVSLKLQLVVGIELRGFIACTSSRFFFLLSYQPGDSLFQSKYMTTRIHTNYQGCQIAIGGRH